MQAQPHHHQDRQQQKRDYPEQAGCEQRIPQRGRSARRRQPSAHRRRSQPGGHECIKAGRYGGVVTPNRGIDADFLSLPRHELADAALSAATAAGATHADLRIHRLVNEIIQLRDGELETAVVNREIGLAVRVIVDGTWGFASHAELSPEVAADTARRAVSVASTLAALNTDRVELAPEPVYADATWVSSYQIDPFTVPAAEKIAVLHDYSGRLLAADGVDHVSASLHAVKEQTFYADTVGSSITQQRVRLHARSGGGHRGRRLRVRLDAHARAADGSRLGGAGRRRRVELDRRAGAAAVAAGREDQGAQRHARPDRSGDRPDQPVADHPRIHRSRNRIRPRHRLRGSLRRHVVRHPRQARHRCATARR